MTSSRKLVVDKHEPVALGTGRNGNDQPGESYSVVHLVVQEVAKPLVGPQVLDHMQSLVASGHASQPARIMVALLEPARAAFRNEVRKAARSLKSRAPDVKVAVVPYVSRLSLRQNAAVFGHYLKSWSRQQRVVFHCRGERATTWAHALSPFFDRPGILADIRGPWPEEILFAGGETSYVEAATDNQRDYDVAMLQLRNALAEAHHVTTVSVGMRDWLATLGVGRDRITYVPCCTKSISFDDSARDASRSRLGLSDKLVLVYSGGVSQYQYLTEGMADFVRQMMRLEPSVHLLAVTPDVSKMIQMLNTAGVDARRTTVLCVSQEEVSRTIMAGDAGLIFGKRGTLKSVVQPVKFAEYLAAGLPVIVSRGSRGMDPLIETYDAGILVEYSEARWRKVEIERIIQTLRQERETLREGALKLCREHFLWARYADSMRAAYVNTLEAASANARCFAVDTSRATVRSAP